MTRAAWLAGTLAMCAITACAAANRSSHAGAAPSTDTMPMMRDPDHAEIARLSDAIDASLRSDGLLGTLKPVRPDGDPLAMAVVPSSHDEACHPATSDACTDSCTLADSICDNAKKICDLAVKLAGDRWATDKCADAKSSCDQSHTKCCECR